MMYFNMEVHVSAWDKSFRNNILLKLNKNYILATWKKDNLLKKCIATCSNEDKEANVVGTSEYLK